MSNNFNLQQGSNISNKQSSSEGWSKTIIVGITGTVIAGLILFYIFGIK